MGNSYGSTAVEKEGGSAAAGQANLPPPLPYVEAAGISPEELAVFRLQYQAFRAGQASGAKGELAQIAAAPHTSSVSLPAGGASLDASQDPQAARPSRKVAVLGCGAFGTAMATVVARNGHNVWIYGRDPESCRLLNETRHNPKYLKEFELPSCVTATSDLAEALADTQFVFLALPAQQLPAFLKEHRDLIPNGAVLVSTAKGLYVKTKQLLSDAIFEAIDRPKQPFAILSGPSFAQEIMIGHPTTVVVASEKMYDAVSVQRLMSSLTFRVYTTQDLVGVELGGALKNPLAVGAGVIEGLGFGINTMSAYITRSCKELTQLVVAMGGKPETVAGLSGVGDLMLTAFGNLSRNRTCGIRLAKGEALQDILRDATVEGVPTAEVAVHFANACGLELPIFRVVQKVIDGRMLARDAGRELMGRPLGVE